MTVTTEIELKLAIPRKAVRLLKKHPLLLAAGAASGQRLRSIYFDTPELELRARGCALRLRRAGRIWLQTFKQGGSASAGLHARIEVEFAVGGRDLELGRLRDVPGTDFLRRKRVANRLIPAFETLFTRTAWQLVTEDGSIVEVALDQGDIWSAGRNLPLSEVELELISGDPMTLYRLAMALQNTVPLMPENRSKAERGYALFQREEPAPVKRAPVALASGMSPGHALHIIVAGCLAQLEANAEGARIGEDAEFVHLMRVALRRLRAAFSIFAQPAAGAAGLAVDRELKAELRDLAATLGVARNWDVFAGQALQPIADAFPDNRELSALTQHAQARRAEAYQRVRFALDAPQYARLLLRVVSHTGAASSVTATARDTLRARARNALGKRHRQLVQVSASLVYADAQQRHRLRIHAKKLRYAAEFFTGLFAPAAVARYTKSLTALQDLLGRMNDIVTARNLLDTLTLAAATRMLAESWLAAKEHEALQALPLTLERVAAADKFWKRS